MTSGSSGEPLSYRAVAPVRRSRPVGAGLALLACLTATGPGTVRAQAPDPSFPPGPPSGEAEPDTVTAILSGRVGIAATGEPLDLAYVHVLGAERNALTGLDGAYRLEGLPPGLDTVQVSYLGFLSEKVAIHLTPGGSYRVDVPLDRTAIEVAELLVEVERAGGARMRGYHERRERGIGHFIDRREIDKRNPAVITDLLVRVPRVRVVWQGALGRGSVALRTPVGGLCRPPIYVDGFPMPGVELDQISPSSVEAVEIYRGPSETPARFGDGRCGAVVVWTRYGDG